MLQVSYTVHARSIKWRATYSTRTNKQSIATHISCVQEGYCLAMERNKLFEGFFFIEPTREKPTDKFQDTRVVYSVPSDINQIAKEFRDVSQFCFPGIHINTHLIICLSQ